MLAVKFSMFIKYMRCPFVPTSLSKMQWLHITTEYFLLQHCMRLLCSVIVSCSLPHYICIFLTLVSAYSPHPLNPSSSINPLQKPATGSDIHQHHPSCFAMFPQSQGNSSIYGSWSAGKAGGKWREGRRSGIEWGSIEWKDEGWGGGILWEGSQSNYKQWCSPGFFGGTKFTFRRSLPPSPSTFLLLLLKMPIPATLFPIFLLIVAHTHIL